MLSGAGGAVVCLAIFWLVIHNVPTETTRIETDLNALKKAILDKDQDAALLHVADDFKYRTKTREKWYTLLQDWLAEHRVDELKVSDFHVNNASRAEKNASVTFHLEARRAGKPVESIECPGWKVTLEDDVWKLQQVVIRHAVFKDVPHGTAK